MYRGFHCISTCILCMSLLGHGNATTLKVPVKVPSIDKVCQVACGNTHTLILSEDGNTVWSCGSGDGGKLGHGDFAKYNTPKV